MFFKAQIHPKPVQAKGSAFLRSILTLSCLGLLASSVVAFSGCAGGGSSAEKEEKKQDPLTMSVVQLDQLSRMDEKTADGQYLVARVSLKNNTNATIVLLPDDFSLQNITKNETERYSQPVEKGMSNAFGKVYGEALGTKVMDFEATNLYPRMQLERYFVFMVPSDSVLNGYQIAYKPSSLSFPLVKPEVTIINDHRTEAPAANDNQPIQPNQP
jgi:hypothetical protein